MTTLQTIKNKLDKLTRPRVDNSIVVCWCDGERVCDYHRAHPDAPEPRHVRIIGGVSLEDF